MILLVIPGHAELELVSPLLVTDRIIVSESSASPDNHFYPQTISQDAMHPTDSEQSICFLVDYS